MAKKRCVACGNYFQARPQVPHQSYCSLRTCQSKRRQDWQRLKLLNDPDHRENKSRAQRNWQERNPDYWRRYREAHPDYVERNKLKQRSRSASMQVGGLAKTDVRSPPSKLPPGVYQLELMHQPFIAKKYVWIVEIREHTCSVPPPVAVAKI